MKRLIFTLIMALIFILIGIYAVRAVIEKTNEPPRGGTIVRRIDIYAI